MKPVRTPESDAVWRLPGGNEDNDLWGQRINDGVKTVWEPSENERTLLAGGARVVLVYFGELVPPTAMSLERPFCRACKGEMYWEDRFQRYVCPEHPPE